MRQREEGRQSGTCVFSVAFNSPIFSTTECQLHNGLAISCTCYNMILIPSRDTEPRVIKN